ncbi:DUF402 domain-containing protein [Microbacterium aurantiacum]|uniref:DUF402 domain-containing protein n=1 Tax=Microbacterium aurantiacum TaxID=162393 RepID=UPI0026292FDE|nr:DUF402 domain-containing protein [Microbacterium aurantiacum]
MSENTVPDRPPVGSRILFRWRKWDGSEHWVHDCVFLGSDRWGDWVGQRAGWRSFRPGRDNRTEFDNVTLLPPTGDYAFTRNARPDRTHTYIDLGWDVTFRGGEPTGIDMDLDVVDRAVGGIYIDDRDEWDEHRVHYGYPADIVAHLEALAVDLERKVRAAEAPFDEATADAWLERLAALGAA